MKWADLMRGSDVTISQRGVHSFHRYLVERFRNDRPFDEFARETLTSLGNTLHKPAANFHRIARTPDEAAEAMAQLFLGVRIGCAKCHNHPFEAITQDDYYGFAAYFARIKFKGKQFMLDDEVVYLDRGGDVRHPTKNINVAPAAFGVSAGELGPDDERPIGQRIQEIGWLVGVQFSVLVMPSSGHGGAAAVLAGQPDSVAQQGRGLLDDNWRIKVDQRGETAIVSIPAGADNPTGWDQLGDALQAASRLVVREGRIIVLSDLAAEPGPGIGILRSCRSARAALQPLRKESPPDLVPASQIAAAADWASVYLLSKLAPSLVEELFMTPLESEAEVTRLIESCDGCIIVTGAQHVYSEILE